MGRTNDIAQDRAYDSNKLVTDQNLTDQFSLKRPPGRKAYTLFQTIVGWQPEMLRSDQKYTITIADMQLGDRYVTFDELQSHLAELTSSEMFWHDIEKKEMHWGHIVDYAKANYSKEGLLTVTIRVGEAFRIYMEQSEVFSILDRITIEQFKSKYGVFLYQRLVGKQGYTKTNCVTWTIENLRKVLSIPDGKLKRGNGIIKMALDPAIKDINAYADFLTYYTVKRGNRNRIASVTVSWRPKAPTEAGGRASQAKQTQTPMSKSVQAQPEQIDLEDYIAKPTGFPTGYIKSEGNEHWRILAETHTPRMKNGHLPDLERLTSQFQGWIRGKGMSLQSPNIEKTFIGFCKGYQQTPR